MPESSGLRHPASATALDRALHPAGRGPNSNSLFLPLAAVVAVALRRGESSPAACLTISLWRGQCIGSSSSDMDGAPAPNSPQRNSRHAGQISGIFSKQNRCTGNPPRSNRLSLKLPVRRPGQSLSAHWQSELILPCPRLAHKSQMVLLDNLRRNIYNKDRKGAVRMVSTRTLCNQQKD